MGNTCGVTWEVKEGEKGFGVSDGGFGCSLRGERVRSTYLKLFGCGQHPSQSFSQSHRVQVCSCQVSAYTPRNVRSERGPRRCTSWSRVHSGPGGSDCSSGCSSSCKDHTTMLSGGDKLHRSYHNRVRGPVRLVGLEGQEGEPLLIHWLVLQSCPCQRGRSRDASNRERLQLRSRRVAGNGGGHCEKLIASNCWGRFVGQSSRSGQESWTELSLLVSRGRKMKEKKM